MKSPFIINLAAVVLILMCILLFDWICPIQMVFGIPCPGCMMTTAFYYLIQFDLESALFFNPAILVVGTGSILLFLTRKNTKAQRIIFWMMISIWLLIYMIRMIRIFPNWPMEYQKQSLIGRLIERL